MPLIHSTRLPLRDIKATLPPAPSSIPVMSIFYVSSLHEREHCCGSFPGRPLPGETGQVHLNLFNTISLCARSTCCGDDPPSFPTLRVVSLSRVSPRAGRKWHLAVSGICLSLLSIWFVSSKEVTVVFVASLHGLAVFLPMFLIPFLPLYTSIL